MELSWSHVLTSWETDSIGWLGTALEAASGLLYIYGVVRVARGGRRWPAHRTAAFLGGLLCAAFVLQSGFASYDDDLLWVHMTQHLVLMMLAAPLLALGAPVRLALTAGSRRARRVIADLLHDPSLRLVSGRSAGVLLPLDYYGSMAVYTLTPLYRLSETNQGFHVFIHVYFLSCGLLFWVPLLGADPATWRPSFRLKLAVLWLGIPAYLGLAGGMLAEGRFISPAHSLNDIHRGAVAMAVGGIVLTLAGLLLVSRREVHRRNDRSRRLGAPPRRERLRHVGQLEVITVPGNADRHRDTPLLLVHGICHGAWCWQPNYAPYFADLGYDVHALSLRGHGESAGHQSLHRHRLEDYVDDVAETASSLPAPPIVIGHSMGGAITQVVALDHPTVIRAAVLLAPLGPGALKLRELGRTVRRFRRVPPLLRLLVRGKVTPPQANRLPFFDGRLDDERADLAAEHLQDESWRALLEILTRFDTRPGAASIPMLLVGSSRDAIFEAPALRRTAAHYEIDPAILETGCHDLMLDPSWRESADVIATWMEML